ARARRQAAGGGAPDALAGDRDVIGDQLGAGGAPAVQHRGARRRADAEVRIEDQVVRARGREHEALDQLDRELAGVDRLLDVVRLDVGEDPHVARVLTGGMAAVLAGARSLEGALAGILLWHAHGIEVEVIGVAAREPEDRLVTARETARAVEPVLEVPDDAVAEPEIGVAAEERVEDAVE